MTEAPGAGAAGTITIGGDLEVTRLGFGAMRITGPGAWGPPADPEQARAVLRRTLELGVTLIDTADSYGPAVSEELIAEALHPYPEGLVIATKAGLPRSGPGQIAPNGRPDFLRQACEGSLRRLRRDRIDLYQLHAVDPEIPLEESLGALTELQREGKIRHIGVSNVRLDQLQRARQAARVVSVQNQFNLADRRFANVLEACERDGLAFLPWAPLSRTGGQVGATVDRIADDHDATPWQIAIAWLLQRSPAMVPIPGTHSVQHLEANVRAAGLVLSKAEVDRLDAARPPLPERLRRAARGKAARAARALGLRA